MKNLAFTLLGILPFLFSCSSDSDSSTPAEFFNMQYEGNTVNITQFEAQRSEKTIAVTALASDGLAISFEFNELGNIGNAYIYPTSSSSAAIYSLHGNYRHFASNYFTFNLINLDTENKTVEVSFSGNLYEDQYTLEDGTSKAVQGSFKVKYVDVVPEVSGLGFSAEFNDGTFLNSVGDVSGGFFSGNDIALTYYNGSKYTLTLNMNHDNTAVGSYNYNLNSTVNNVVLSKYDTAAESYIDYTTRGSLTITEKIVGAQITVVSGTFNFTGTNPLDSSQITVTNGKFKVGYTTY